MSVLIAIFMTLLLLGFSSGAAAQSGIGDEHPRHKAGRVNASERVAMPDLPGQEQAAALKRQYAAAIKERLAEIRIAIDPIYTEQLQKEIAELKATEEKAQVELQMEFAVQSGDEERAVQLEQQLNFYYREKKQVTSDMEPKQVPGMSTIRSWTRNPDDS